MLKLGRQQQMLFLLVASIIIILLSVSLINIWFGSGDEIQIVEPEMDMDNKGNNDSIYEVDGEYAPNEIKVYITGEVDRPGVVSVPEGSRLIDVVEVAGGFLEEADLTRVNLAQRVHDEGMYIIPKIGEEIDFGIITADDSISDQNNIKKININTADQSALESLPGIGPVWASGIIEYREKNGPYKGIEDIMNVSGIGEKRFEAIKDYITVNNN